MKKLITNNNQGHPATLNDFRHLQEALQETLAAVLKSDIIGTLSPFVLHGCVITTGAGNVTNLTPGAIFYNNEVYLVNQQSFTGTGTLRWKIVESYAAYDPVKFKDNVFRNVHKNETLQLTFVQAGSAFTNASLNRYVNPVTNLIAQIQAINSIIGTDTFGNNDNLRKQINDEKNNRIASYNALQSQINQKASLTTVSNNKIELQNQIGPVSSFNTPTNPKTIAQVLSELTALIGFEGDGDPTSLQSQILQEVADRIAAINSVNNNINNLGTFSSQTITITNPISSDFSKITMSDGGNRPLYDHPTAFAGTATFRSKIKLIRVGKVIKIKGYINISSFGPPLGRLTVRLDLPTDFSVNVTVASFFNIFFPVQRIISTDSGNNNDNFATTAMGSIYKTGSQHWIAIAMNNDNLEDYADTGSDIMASNETDCKLYFETTIVNAET